MKRVRPITITVQVEAVTDDGEFLVPLRIDAVKFTVAEFEQFDLAAELAQIEEAINASAVQDDD